MNERMTKRTSETYDMPVTRFKIEDSSEHRSFSHLAHSRENAAFAQSQTTPVCFLYEHLKNWIRNQLGEKVILMEDGDLNKQVPNYYNDDTCPTEG